MANTSTLSSISFRVDSKLKNDAESLFSQLGMSMATAYKIFLTQSVREGRIPFEITINTPNSETIAAMREAERIAKDPQAKKYLSVDDLMADLDA